MAEEARPNIRRVRDPERTRRVIVEAALAAVEEGNLAPTARDVARRAGVSERSVFTHFATLDEIRVEAARLQESRVDAIPGPVDASGSLAERLDALLQQRERMYPLQTGIRRAALVHASASPDLSAIVAGRRSRFKDQVTAVLAPELASVDDREVTVAVLEAVLDWSFRHQLVDRQGLSHRSATRAIRAAVLGALATPLGGQR